MSAAPHDALSLASGQGSTSRAGRPTGSLRAGPTCEQCRKGKRKCGPRCPNWPGAAQPSASSSDATPSKLPPTSATPSVASSHVRTRRVPARPAAKRDLDAKAPEYPHLRDKATGKRRQLAFARADGGDGQEVHQHPQPGHTHHEGGHTLRRAMHARTLDAAPRAHPRAQKDEEMAGVEEEGEEARSRLSAADPHAVCTRRPARRTPGAACARAWRVGTSNGES